MLQLINISIDHGRLGALPHTRLTERRDPLFSWGALSNRESASQSACRIVVDGLWDSGWVAGSAQELRYGGDPLPEGVRITFSLTIRDDAGEESEVYRSSFFYAGVDWKAPWIGVPGDKSETVRYFTRSFSIEKPLADACLYACGIGYARYSINGGCVDISASLNPAFTEWKKTCQYVLFPEIASRLKPGENRLDAVLAAGWRYNPKVLPNVKPDEIPYEFLGPKMLTAMLKLVYEDGEIEWIYSDEGWRVGEGPLVTASLFDGVTYDAARTIEYRGNAAVVEGPGGVLRPMIIPPIRAFEARSPIAVWPKGNGVVMDFGQNLAGVLRIWLPKNLAAGQTIALTHSEELDEDGDLYVATLRAADARDTYIAAGDGQDMLMWQPEFTYHGFRYAKIEGLGTGIDARRVEAIELRTDLETRSSFRCGNALVTRIHEICVETERSNMHSILTDCPQRNERMGWMNDATVRFEETPYNFDVGRMFPKIIRDLMDEQGADGAITCTAPFAYGSRPADPVSSSFLVAGLEAVLHKGDLDVVREAYDQFQAWENCLLAHSDDFIVNYSYYGDWAGPLDACEYTDKEHPGARSVVTPGLLMSSGYSYLNCVLLARFADWLGRPDDATRHAETAEKVKAAILKKWYDGKTGVMATGSQGCQAFALCMGLIPAADAKKAARVLHDDLVRRDYRITTGNLCTRYMLDVLAEHGYIEDAWRLLTRETYPSLGYMIQQEATTVWERFELMKNAGMNSHNHPMYAAADYFLYAYIAGVKPTEPGWARFVVEPHMPENLLSAQAVVDTVRGEVSVRWTRRYGARHLHVTVPFGARAEVRFCGLAREVGSGFHTFTVED